LKDLGKDGEKLTTIRESGKFGHGLDSAMDLVGCERVRTKRVLTRKAFGASLVGNTLLVERNAGKAGHLDLEEFSIVK
jgi:hypothetical protein